MECKYYKNINGVKGECASQPPTHINGNWVYPMVDKGCECRFYKEPSHQDGFEYVASIKPVDVKPEPAVEKKLTARQKALKAKKEAEGK